MISSGTLVRVDTIGEEEEEEEEEEAAAGGGGRVLVPSLENAHSTTG